MPILTELGRALNEPYFRRRLSGQDIVDLLALLVEQATMVAPVGAVPRVATHPEDDLILATAVVARADYLVTGDKHLQVLTTHQSSVIVSPRAFLEILTG